MRAAAITAALVLASTVALLAGGVFFAAGIHPAHAQTPPEGFVPGEVLVKFEPGASGQERSEAHRQNDGEVEEIIPDIGVRVVEVPAGRERSIVAAYERNPNVSYAELNTIIRITDHVVPNDPRGGEQWQFNKIDAFNAWHVTEGSNTVDIAILDTGIDQSHEDFQVNLQSKVVKTHNSTTNKSVEDKNGHGTHVAGSAAAVTNNEKGVAGTCPDCVLYNGKVVGDDGSGTLSGLAKGITWAVDPNNDGNTDDGAEVISMSLGSSSGSRTLRDAVNDAWGKGVVLVAAAGNGGKKAFFYPAAYPNVIAVGATNHKDAKPKFSNFGGWVDIGAPGVNILSTLPGNDRVPEGRYGILRGTSMATPHVAGVAGLVWAATDSSGTNLCSTNECVRGRIETGADQIPGLADYWTGGRRLNANNAVTSPSSPE